MLTKQITNEFDTFYKVETFNLFDPFYSVDKMEADHQPIGTLDTDTGEQTLQSIAMLRSPEYFMEVQEFQQEIPINVVPSAVPAPQPML